MTRITVFSDPLTIARSVEVKELSKKNHPVDSKPKDEPKKSSYCGLDPLSAALAEVGLKDEEEDDDDDVIDPLSGISGQPVKKLTQSRSSSLSSHSSSLPTTKDGEDQGWNVFRQEILSSCTTNTKLSLKSSFLAGGTLVKPTIAQTASVTDKVKNRLEQLDEMTDDIREEHNLTQKEYINRIEELNRQLISAWSSDQRVKALKITIQSAKMLAEASTALDFYPSKFALVSDILDTFGGLVYSRIRERSLTATDEQAMETCKNWFFKIASIRELIPRFYVECAIMKIYVFLRESPTGQKCPGSVSSCISRLSQMIRGMSNPLVAAYARVYLSHVAVKLMHVDKSFIRMQVDEVYNTTDQFPTYVVQDYLDTHRLSLENYCQLYTPCFQWFCKNLGQEHSDHVLDISFRELMTIISSNNEPEMNLVLLNGIVSSFKANYVTKSFEVIWSTLQSHCVVEDSSSYSNLFVSLGKAFSAKLQGSPDLSVLQRVWDRVSLLPLLHYLPCAESWVSFVANNFTHKEINSFLRDVVKHVGEKSDTIIPIDGSSNSKTIDRHLERIVNKIFTDYSKNYCHLMSMETVVHMIQSVQEDSTRISVSKFIVTSFMKKMNRAVEEYDIPEESIDVLNNLGFLCQIIHDSVSAISLEDDKRDIALLITGYLRLVLFSPGLDIETRFKLLQEARANFFNIDQVLAFLVFAVNSLPSKQDDRSGSSDFVRTCLAYSFTTIPSIEDPVQRLQLYLNSSEVAVSNGCLSQLESFLKTTIKELSQLPRTAEGHDGSLANLESTFFMTCSSLMTLLLVTPDHPDHEVLYLFKGLLNMIEHHDSQTSDLKAKLYLQSMTFLCWASQETYPVLFEGGKYLKASSTSRHSQEIAKPFVSLIRWHFHVFKLNHSFLSFSFLAVDMNDVLYGGDTQFLDEVSQLNSKVLKMYLEHVSSLSNDEKSLKTQAQMCLQLFQVMVVYADIKFMGKLVVKLWQIMLKYSACDKSFKVSNTEPAIDLSSGYRVHLLMTPSS